LSHREDSTAFRRNQIPNSKSQTPTTKERDKVHKPNRAAAGFSLFRLPFVWSLEIGVWGSGFAISDFGFRISVFLLWLLVAQTGAGEGGKPMEKKLPLDGQVFQVDGYTAFLILPAPSGDKQPIPKPPIPWVWYAPTLPGLPGPEERWMFERFLAAGLAIAGVDVGESCGSPKGRAGFSALYRELTEKRGLSKKACLLARSRGGLMLYNWACENAESVACVAGIYPVCNLVSYPGVAQACGAYGMSAAALTEQLQQHNPIDRLAPLAKAGVSLFHIHGDVDTMVPLKDNSGEVARRYRELGGKMELLIPPGQGHNMWQGFFQCKELVDFVITQATSKDLRK